MTHCAYVWPDELDELEDDETDELTELELLEETDELDSELALELEEDEDWANAGRMIVAVSNVLMPASAKRVFLIEGRGK